MASTSTQTDILSNLPSELLHQIFVRCEPKDLSSISQVNRTLYRYVQDDVQLWKDVYNEHWDYYLNKGEDHLTNSTYPPTRSITATKEPYTPSINQAKGKSPSFDYSQQVKRRTWAERRLKSLQKRPIDLYANYNDTLRALISIARSRSARTLDKEHSFNKDNLSKALTAEYLTNLLTSKEQIDVFRQAIYPRNDVTVLREWQLKNLSEERARLKSMTNAQIKREEKRARSSSATSIGSPEKSKRKRTSTNGSIVNASNSNGIFLQTPKRRSARVQLHNYPSELHHLLYEKNGNDLITLDDGTGLANLEGLELLDEQLAAELHVLHGVHPGFPIENNKRSNQQTVNNDPNQQNGQPSIPAEHSPLQETDSDDSDFSDHGTPTDEEGNAEEDSDGEIQSSSEEEEDDGLPDNLFHFFINRMTANRRHQEPALGGNGAMGQKANKQLRGKAREIVYDTARYGLENNFGPLCAWRERFEPIDGPRLYAPQEGVLEDEEEDEEWDPEQDWVEMVDADLEEDTGEEEGEEEEENEGVEGTIVNGLLVEDNLANEEDEEADPDFDTEGDSSDEAEDDDEERQNQYFELRSMAISLSRGVLPWAEASRLANKFRKETKKGQPVKVSFTNPSEEEVRPNKSLADVWRTEKRVDWVVVESVMIVMYCNIRHAVLNHGWGRSFRLPDTTQSLLGRDRFARQIHSEFIRSPQDSGHWEVWRDLIGLPVGWNHSRGTIDTRFNSTKEQQPEQEEKKQKDLKAKPYDWAGVESVWIGTYAFLDWTIWAAYNSRDPQTRGLPDPREPGLPDAGPFPMGHNRGDVTLAFEREALGDCLQLRLEVLPLDEQVPFNDSDLWQSYLEGYDEEFIDLNRETDSWKVDPEIAKSARSTCQKSQGPGQYPPLRFRGHTRTYVDEGEAIPRGECYGVVRPVYATERDDPTSSTLPPKSIENNQNRSIVALHWEITHRYDGEDAWSLSGIQAGPPGTRSPIYGVWGSSERDNMSPCGPFAYYKVDERRWKDLEPTINGRSTRI